MEANLQRDKHARLCNTVNQLIDELTPAAPDFQLQQACDQLVPIQSPFAIGSLLITVLTQLFILTDTPEMLSQLVSSHGMLAILEVLEGNCSREVNMKLLHIVNLVRPPLITAQGRSHPTQLVTEDAGFLESFCLIGCASILIPLLS